MAGNTATVWREFFFESSWAITANNFAASSQMPGLTTRVMTPRAEFLRVSLADIAAQFLGPDDWKPVADARSVYRRGRWRAARNEYDRAIADYARAIELDARHIDALNGWAWILATCPEEKHRNGSRAVELAQKACELSSFDRWHCLDTLAAAYAEARDFAKAVSVQSEALWQAPEEQRAGCKERLGFYQEEKPYRSIGNASNRPSNDVERISPHS